MEKRPFNELGLSPELLKAVDKMGFEEASPIQTAVIPHGLAGAMSSASPRPARARPRRLPSRRSRRWT
jgi:superfamily II DNA/RNA helicase